jgi:hypothetical protein
VGLTLHHRCTLDDAIAANGGDARRPRSFCEDSFVVLPKVVICLISVGEGPAESHLSSPSCAVWRSIQHRSLPEEVTEVYDRSKKPIKKLKEHHVLLRAKSDCDYLFAGPAHLGSYGGPAGGGLGVQADFTLNNKLTREDWLHFGGFPGWLVDVNHETRRIDNGDVKTLKKLLKDVPRQKYSHLHMTRYEEDALTIHTNARRGWLMYERNPFDGGIYVQEMAPGEDSEREELFKCVCGIDLEFPVAQTVPRDLALRAAEEFFVSGDLPRCVHWE